MSNSPPPERAALRQHYRSVRRNLSAAARAKAEAQICGHLVALLTQRNPRVWCAYLANDGEADIAPLITPATAPVGLPRITEKLMHFHAWSPGEPLVRNRFQIDEPEESATRLDAARIELLLMPLVAFDAAGNRLGMGGGFYDRFLGSQSVQPYCVGVAFAEQQAPSPLPSAAWDIPLHAVVTQHGVVKFPSTSESAR